MGFFQWLSEVGFPHKRCARKGHKVREQTRRGYAYPSAGFRSVADSFTEERKYCGRCGEDIEPWHETNRSSLQGLTMNADRWDELKKTGRIIC